MNLTERGKHRIRAAAVHLILSALIATGVGVVTLALWYPGRLGAIAGGRQLFWLVVGVDVVIGPLITLVVFNTTKPRRELARDLTIVGVLQLIALGYGLNTAFEARPVAVVFEVDSFRVVPANAVRVEELSTAPPEYQQLPLYGPWLLGVRASSSGAEKLASLDLALKGFDIGQRPSYWQPYARSRAAAVARARPIDILMQRLAGRKGELEAILAELHVAPADARFLPLNARGDGVVILDGSGDVLGYAPFDGYF
jgi:hypothetical protein